MSSRVYLGILGDPAKIELYPEEFYKFLNYDETKSCYYLLGASERDVTKDAFALMYQSIKDETRGGFFPPIPSLTEGLSNNFTSRVGLFPSSASHLINGPEFTFSPYPINSTSNWLRFKSRFLTHVLQPFVKIKIIPLGYHPMGGMAAQRTLADTTFDPQLISNRFIKAHRSRYLRWLYLEGGSGEEFMGIDRIEQILHPLSNKDGVLESFIYGGGINHPRMVEEIFSMSSVPQSIVVGNISESNITLTYDILDKVVELNETL